MNTPQSNLNRSILYSPKHDTWRYAVIAAIAITLIGAGALAPHPSADASLQARANEAPLQEDLAEVLSVEEIKALVAKEQPDTNLSTVELEQEGNSVVYKVILANGKALRYNAQTGKLIATKTALAEEKDKDSLPTNFTASITFAQAREIALTENPGTAVRKIELEVENGIVVYSVRFTNDARVDVSAADGTIVRTKEAKAVMPTRNNSTNNTSPEETKKNEINRGSSNAGGGDEQSGWHHSNDNHNHAGHEAKDNDNSGSNPGSGSNSGSGSSQ